MRRFRVREEGYNKNFNKNLNKQNSASSSTFAAMLRLLVNLKRREIRAAKLEEEVDKVSQTAVPRFSSRKDRINKILRLSMTIIMSMIQRNHSNVVPYKINSTELSCRRH